MQETIKISKSRKYWLALRRLIPKRNHVLIACFPKSGNTFLRTLVANLPNMKAVSLTTGYDRREQELSIEKLIFLHKQNYVASHHIRSSTITSQLLNDFMIKPIVLVRNIFDVTISLIDHFHKEDIIFPMAYAPKEILIWDENKSSKFIIEMVLPWYFNFYVSWYLNKNKFLVTYDELIKDTATTFCNIAEYANIPFKKSDIEFSIQKSSKQNTRKNVGISGRGEKLPDNLKDKIRSFSEYYPDINFLPIGI